MLSTTALRSQYSNSPTGQLLFDMNHSKLSDAAIAKKHKMPVKRVAKLRPNVQAILRKKANGTRKKVAKKARRRK